VGPTRRYNVLFHAETLDALERFCDGVEISKAAFVRGAVSEALNVSPVEGAPTSPHSDPVPDDQGYTRGVEDACARMAKNSRLALKMTSGQTMGEDIAGRILKDLLG